MLKFLMIVLLEGENKTVTLPAYPAFTSVAIHD
jgi:hypothetical protein